MPLSRDCAFERGITQLIADGHFQRVEYLVGEAIKANGSPALQAASAASQDVMIAGWDALAADMLRADLYLVERCGRPSAAISLDLVNRDDEPGLPIVRSFHVEIAESAPKRGTASWKPPFDASPVTVEGLEPLMAIQRRKLPPEPDAGKLEGVAAETAISGLLILSRYHAAVARHLLDPGLPRALQAIVGVESVEWPMEQGVYEYGPFARRTIDVAAVQRDLAAAQAKLDERKRANQAHHDRVTAQSVTEMREKRFLLMHWPASTDRDKRRKAIEMFEAGLKLTFSDLDTDAPDWDAPDAAFDTALRRFAESRRPGDIDAVLGRFDSDDRTQLHLMFLDYALRFGGREVQKHWLRARGHAV